MAILIELFDERSYRIYTGSKESTAVNHIPDYDDGFCVICWDDIAVIQIEEKAIYSQKIFLKKLINISNTHDFSF